MTRIAVIGGGAAGIGAARRLLTAGKDVVLIETGPQLGGNCQVAEVRGDDGTRWTIDAGVSDFNRTTFLEFSELVDELGLATRPIGTDTSFATPDGHTVASCRRGDWRFDDRVAGIVEDGFAAEAERFRLRVTEVLDEERFADWSLGRYLDHIGASRALRELYVLPRAIGAFPMPDRRAEELPLRGLIEFLTIHGVVGAAPADRHCVVGGMHRYPAVFARWFEGNGGELRCGTRVLGITRSRRGVSVRAVDGDGRESRLAFDHVLLATHPQQTLSLLDGPTPAETKALGAFAQQRARVVVHRDARVVGDDRSAFGAFNYVVPRGRLPSVRPTITFFPNRLAGLPSTAPDIFVTMNPHLAPDPDLVVSERVFVHPMAASSQRAAAASLDAIQGYWRTWFAGSYLRSPFVHESALVSGRLAAERLLASERAQQRLSVDRAVA